MILDELAPFSATPIPPVASPDYRAFFVGWDNVHGVLKYLLSRDGISSLTVNMFGYDDEELNNIIMGLVINPMVLTMITLDKSQAGGVHEKKLIAADKQQNLAAFNSHFVIGQSATHSISHTKGGVIRYADGAAAWEGSTNWSTDGEGTFLVGHDQAGGPGYKAQNNTVVVHANPYEVQRFEDRLRAEHLIAQKQAK
jgi:hypothetical protein